MEKSYELHPSSADNPSFKKLLHSLKQWINQFNTRGVAISNILQDISVPLVLASAIEQMTGDQLVESETLLAPTIKSYQLLIGILVQYVKKNLGMNPPPERWSLEGLVSRDISSLVCFLVDVAYSFQCPFPIPENVSIAVVCVQNIDGAMTKKTTVHQITAPGYNAPSTHNLYDPSADAEMDAFEELISSPEQFEEVKALLLQYCNEKLAECHIKLKDVAELRTDQLVVLIGILGGFFVPMSLWQLKPKTPEQKLKNAETCMMFLDQFEIPTDRVTAQGTGIDGRDCEC
ncbi:hypothetical protein EDD86DRAFT_189825 [Gorgonomyces haynaldii]|nr:hypothetical protein EDD86DRAFT_189825 [Gorgonomyces haynaldii]